MSYIINSKRFGGIVDGLLDDYPAKAMWSVDNIWYSAYTGPVIEVYNGVTYQDFLPNEITNGDLATFLNGADGLVRTEYDVTGNGNHRSNVTTAEMNIIAVAGVVNIGLDGKPFIITPINTGGLFGSFTTTGAGSIFAVYNSDSLSSGMLATGEGGTKYLGIMQNGSTSGVDANTGGVCSYFSNGTVITPANRDTLYDSYTIGADVLITINIPNFSNWTQFRTFNYASGGFKRISKNKAFLLYDGGNSQSANQTEIETIINDYYSIY